MPVTSPSHSLKDLSNRPSRSALITVAVAVALLLAALITITAGPARAAASLLSQGKPATASSTENATPGVGGRRRQHRHPLVERVQRPAVAPGRPRRVRDDQPGRAQLGDRRTRSPSRSRPRTTAATWTSIYSTTTGTGGMQTLTVTGTGRYVRMYGTVRATAVRLLAVGVPGLRHDRRHVAPAAPPTPRRAAPRPRRPPRTPTSRPPARSTATPAPAGRARSATRSGSRSTSVARRADLQVVLTWEAAYATAFQIQVSTDAATWTNDLLHHDRHRRHADLTVTGTGRYMRMNGTARATAYGYSLFEFAVHTTGAAAPRRTTPPTTTPTGPAARAPPASFWGDTSTHPGRAERRRAEDPEPHERPVPGQPGVLELQRQAHSIADQPYFDMPVNSAGRMYFYLGSPTSQYYDFIEFTVGGERLQRQHHPGRRLRPEDRDAAARARRLRRHRSARTSDLLTRRRAATFAQFQNAVPREFKVLAQTQAPYRIRRPGSDPRSRPAAVTRTTSPRTRSPSASTRPPSNIFGCAGVARREPGRVRGAQPARGAAAAGVQWYDAEPVLPGRAGELLREVLARQRDQQPGVRLPVRRRAPGSPRSSRTRTRSGWRSRSAGRSSI